MILNMTYKSGGSAYTITSSATGQGTISPDGTTLVIKGGSATYTMTPSSVEYELKTVTVDGVSVTATSPYVFSNVLSDHSIAAAFGIKTYTVASSVSGSGGTITQDKTTVDYGDDVVFTMSPATGYKVKQLEVNNVDVTSSIVSNTYTRTDVTENLVAVVEYEKIKYAITVTQATGGTIDPGTTEVEYGTSQTFTITPDSANGYEITDVLADGVSIGVVTSKTFTNVTSTHTLTATYALKTYTVTCTVDGSTGGTITASPNPVTHGSSCLITCTPSTGYEIDYLKVNGTEVTPTSSGTYTISSVTSAIPVNVKYKLKTYTITVTQGSNGTITPGTVTVNHGGSQTFTITAGTGYIINDVIVDTTEHKGKVTEYTFSNVTADHSITAEFVSATFTLTATAGEGGTITPGTTTVAYLGNQTFTIAADTTHDIDDVLVDGVSQGAITTYTFSLVTADHSISATFKDKTYSVTCSVVGSTGGTIAAVPSTGIAYGGSSVVTCTPASGYSVKEFKVNGSVISLVNDTYTITNITADQTVTVEYTESYTGDFYIDLSLLSTSPTTCVQYVGATDRSAAITAAKAKVWSWLNPSIVKDGEVVYFLDKSDLTKKLDGTAADLTGASGDVMVSIKPLWWEVITNDSSKLEFKISDAEFDGAVTAHEFDGTVRKYLHVGMFHMPATAVGGSNAVSYYSTTIQPWVSQTNDAFRTAAEARGDTYCTMTYRTWTLLELLTVFASGSCDSQTTCGQDYAGRSAATAVATDAMLTANGWTESTKSSATTSLMWMFFSQLWGNVYDFVSGLKTYSGKTGIAKDQANARGVTVSQAIPSTWVSFTSPSCSSYQKAAQGETEYPFFPKTGSGSSSTYYCDYVYSTTSGTYCARVGGRYRNGASAGVFHCDVDYSASDANSFIGARLQCLDVNNA